MDISNGLLIQWGISATPSGRATKVTFPISFSNASYIIIAMASLGDNNTSDYIRGYLWQHKTSTYCLLRTTSETAPTAEIIAIGH